jgi:CRP-like cAMP-binding protein
MEEILQNSPLFQTIDLSASLELRNSMGNIQFVKGQVIFFEGDTGDSLYVILKSARDSWSWRYVWRVIIT